MISVIIPIYNVEQYIDRGLSNILKQTFGDFEILLVDDGSTDGSAQMCDEWTRMDSRVIVIHKENAGAGSARNAGIEVAKGDFIYFFDIDDELCTDALSYCVKTMDEYNLDMLVFGYKSKDIKYKTSTKVQFNPSLIESNEDLRGIFVDNFILTVNGFPWNKMYRKSFLDRYCLRFENQRIQQDEVFNMLCYEHVERLYVSDRVLYTYYVYDKGNTRSRFIADRFEIYKSVREHFDHLLYEHWNINDDRLIDYLERRFFSGIKQCLLFNISHPDCPWDMNQKKIELNKIVNDPDSIRCLDYLSRKSLSIEDKLYIRSIKKENLRQIGALYIFFDNLRRLKLHFTQGD